MLIAGSWRMRHDGSARPIVSAEVARRDTSAVAEDFLVDCGADISVFSASLLDKLNLPVRTMPSGISLSGIGGDAGSVVLAAVIEFTTEDKQRASVRGDFAAFTDQLATDLSILGRDVLDNFDVILSRRRDQVLLLGPGHQYRVEKVNSPST